MMWYDKGAAIKKNRRLSENSLFLIAIFGGSGGIWLGMKSPLYHKAAKAKFALGIPLLVFVQILLGIYFMSQNR